MTRQTDRQMASKGVGYRCTRARWHNLNHCKRQAGRRLESIRKEYTIDKAIADLNIGKTINICMNLVQSISGIGISWQKALQHPDHLSDLATNLQDEHIQYLQQVFSSSKTKCEQEVGSSQQDYQNMAARALEELRLKFNMDPFKTKDIENPTPGINMTQKLLNDGINTSTPKNRKEKDKSSNKYLTYN